MCICSIESPEKFYYILNFTEMALWDVLKQWLQSYIHSIFKNSPLENIWKITRRISNRNYSVYINEYHEGRLENCISDVI